MIAKESAALRGAFKEQDTIYRHRNVAKLLYIHMLGYPTHFGQMETLKLIAASGFPEKRIGYLGLMILLDERHEVLMLVTNSLKNDLNARSQYVVGLALCALGNICSAEMARDLAPSLEKLLDAPNSFIRKKSALCATRVVRKVPEVLESFVDRAAGLLSDRHHGVLLAGVTLMLEICSTEPAIVPVYRSHVPTLARVLKTLLMSPYSPEHDVGGITDPFLQVKILRLLRVLGEGSPEASDAMSDTLAQVATSTESNRNSGYAIQYEAVQTIMNINVDSIGGLRVLAINILGRFLSNKDNNMRYVALNTLAKVVSVDGQAVQRHRNTIVDCVKDADVSIRRRALDLVYALVNEGNIKTLTNELLDYLKVADSEFKPDLTAKVCLLVQRFAPDKRWHFDSLLQILVQAGAYVKEDVTRGLIVLLTNAPDLHGYAARQMYAALAADIEKAELSLIVTCAWFLGEFGELLVGGAGGPLLSRENPEQAAASSAADVVALLERVLHRPQLHAIAREYVLTALVKLSTRFADQTARIQAAIGRDRGALDLEVQARACEYSHLFGFDQLRGQLLEHMPALDESHYSRNMGTAAAVDMSTEPAAAQENASGTAAANPQINADVVGDLLTLNDDSAAVQQSGGQSAADLLQDLLGGDLGSTGSASIPHGSNAGPLLDLLGGGGSPTRSASQPSAQQDPLAALMGSTGGLSSTRTPLAAPPQRGSSDPFADLAGTGPAPASPLRAQPQPPAQSTIPPRTVYDKDGVSVVFAFSKPGGPPNLTDITATYRNSSDRTVSDFSLQAAVPKFMQLKLDAASGNRLQPHGSGSITQLLHITNTQHGIKPIALRLRISFSVDGQQRLEQAEVKDLPVSL